MTSDTTIGLATGDDATVEECGSLWAHAVARRDGTEPDVRRSLGGVRGRLRMRGADLLVAQRDGELVGFATLAPHDDGLEIFHLATSPGAWGQGIGTRLLDGCLALARARRVGALTLWVIEDDARARGVYERAGWAPTEDAAPDDAGRLERRYVRQT